MGEKRNIKVVKIFNSMKKIFNVRYMLGVSALVAFIGFVLVQDNADVDLYIKKLIQIVYFPFACGMFGYSFNRNFSLQTTWIAMSVFAIASLLISSIVYFATFYIGMSYNVRLYSFSSIMIIGGIIAFISMVHKQSISNK